MGALGFLRRSGLAGRILDLECREFRAGDPLVLKRVQLIELIGETIVGLRLVAADVAVAVRIELTKQLLLILGQVDHVPVRGDVTATYRLAFARSRLRPWLTVLGLTTFYLPRADGAHRGQ